VGGTPGVSLGYPLLRTGERLEIYISHARRRRHCLSNPAAGPGLDQKDIYFLSLENEKE